MVPSFRLAYIIGFIYSAALVIAWSPTEVFHSFVRPRAEDSDLQTFTGRLGGYPAPPIKDTGDSSRPFSVDGDTFSDFQSASTRSCDNQFNDCQEKANTDGSKFSVNDCDDQKEKCYSTQENAPVKSFAPENKEHERVPFDSEFDLLCEL